jgi:hypothetical protein
MVAHRHWLAVAAITATAGALRRAALTAARV